MACAGPGAPPPAAPVDRPAGPPLIHYRRLTRADFRATAPAADRRPHGLAFGALSCIRLVPELSQTVVIDTGPDGLLSARVPRAAFYAEFDRTCSWWNPRNDPAHWPYLLQHEQAHFAIVEVQARRLTAQVRGIAVPATVAGDAADTLRRRVARLADSTAVEIRRESDALDRDTFHPNATRQARWTRRLERELRETAGVRR